MTQYIVPNLERTEWQPRCDQCRHWVRAVDDVEWWTEPDTTDEKRTLWLAKGYCGLAASRDGKARTESSRAVALDAECYSARLLTDKSFGCVQWEAK